MLFCYECIFSNFGICANCCNENNICLECINLENICSDCENNDEAIFIDDLHYIWDYIEENYIYFNTFEEYYNYEDDYDY